MRRRDFLSTFAFGAILTPRTARAQQKAMPVVGVLSGGFPGSTATSPLSVAAFRQGLSDTGYIEEQNVAIQYRWAGNRYDRMRALAADLVGLKVDVIACLGNAVTLAAKSTTSTIPIVFAIGTDPVELGLVSSLARPGGNLTGISFLVVELTGKRFDLISELVPQAKMIALLMNPNNEGTERQTRDAQEAARGRGRQLHILKATSEGEIDAAFASLVTSPADAILVGADALFVNEREQLLAFASRHAVPAIYQWREFVDSGGLISYGPSGSSVARKVGIYAGKILKGSARRSPGPAANQIRTGHQSENRESARRHRAAIPPRPRRRGDRVSGHPKSRSTAPVCPYRLGAAVALYRMREAGCGFRGSGAKR